MLENLRRALEVSAEAYRQDRKRPRARRRRNELEFLPAAVEVLETPPSPLGRTIAGLIVLVIVSVLAWAWFGRIDTVAIAHGKIIPSGHVKIIQPLEIGTVKKIHVRDGQQVRAGAPLIDLDPTEAGANLEQLRRSLVSSRLEVARFNALLSDQEAPLRGFTPPRGIKPSLVEQARALLVAEANELVEGLAAIDGEITQRRAERATIGERIKQLNATIPLLEQRVKAFQYLVDREVGRKLRLLELREQLVGQQRQRLVERRRRMEVDAAIKVLQRRRAERVATAERTVRARLAQATDRADSLDQEIRKAQERHRLRILTAPVDGVVQQLSVHTVGAVVTPAARLMVLVPDGSRLEVEANVLNKDVGFVQINHLAEIKIESFPFTKYGLIPGHVEHISADAVADERQGLVYPTRISMGREKILVGDNWVKLVPGMSVTAEVKTGKRRAIEFFLSPFLRYQDEALRER